MSVINRIKSNLLVRGAVSLYCEYFGMRRTSFGYIGERVIVIPPVNIVNPQNVFLYGNNKIIR